jgi:hypothetical protein
MDANQLQELEAIAKNPEQITESPEEIADRDKLRALFINSNPRPRWITEYEAGWKAAKAYYEAQQQ